MGCRDLQFNDAGQYPVNGSEQIDLADALVVAARLQRCLIVQKSECLTIVQLGGSVIGEGIAQCHCEVFLAPIGRLATASDAGAALKISFLSMVPGWGRVTQVNVLGYKFLEDVVVLIKPTISQ